MCLKLTRAEKVDERFQEVLETLKAKGVSERTALRKARLVVAKENCRSN
jgi:hypothetical protein